jgi:hypothetical protein
MAQDLFPINNAPPEAHIGIESGGQTLLTVSCYYFALLLRRHSEAAFSTCGLKASSVQKNRSWINPQPETGETMRKIFSATRKNIAWLVLASSMIPLGGCNLIDGAILWPQVEHANSQMAEAKADCDNKFPPMQGSFLAHAQCIDAAQDWIIRPLAPYPDLLARSQNTRERLAAKVDKGELDPADYARLTEPEDSPLTVNASTRRGPLDRKVHQNYIALPPQRESNGCTSGYGFSGC